MGLLKIKVSARDMGFKVIDEFERDVAGIVTIIDGRVIDEFGYDITNRVKVEENEEEK